MRQMATVRLDVSPAQSIDVAAGRWKIAAAGIAIQMMLGTVYAWSVFKNPLIQKHGWAAPKVTAAFTLMIFFLGVAAAFGGRFVDKAGSRKIASYAAVFFGGGMLLAGLADSMNNLWLLWLGYGILGGIGNGLGYITPIAVLLRWFPDKKGAVTGFAVMGFGIGAALMGQLAPIMIGRVGIANTFYLAGSLCMAVILIAAQKLINPPIDAIQQPKTLETGVSVHFKQSLGMRQFYILWLMLFLNVTAGISIISNLSPMAQSQLRLSNPAVMAGSIVLAASLCNGLGRLLWGWLSEKIGRHTAFVLIFTTQVPLFLILPYVTDTTVFTMMCCYILLCYGGGFGTMPSFAADTFGSKYIGSIYGPLLLAWGAAGAAGPMLMEWVKQRTNSFSGALFASAAILGAGLIVTLCYRKPRG